MLNEVKLISIDLDGTLFKKDGTVSEMTLACLNKCKKLGLLIVFNTARPKKMIPQLLYNAFWEDYWVFSNGTTCMRSNEVLFDEIIPNQYIYSLLYDLHDNHSSYFFSVESKGMIYSPFKLKEVSDRYFAEYRELSDIEIRPINKVLIIAEERNFPIKKIFHSIHHETKLLVTEDGKYIQIMPKGISKLEAVTRITVSHGIKISDVLAFGDDVNDLELIRASGVGVAMENAAGIVKESASFTTLSNENEGVAHFLNQVFLNE